MDSSAALQKVILQQRGKVEVWARLSGHQSHKMWPHVPPSATPSPFSAHPLQAFDLSHVIKEPAKHKPKP